MSVAVRISPRDARRLALAAQLLPRAALARGRAGTLQAIRHLGYVQIDTISVVARAHHHTLWNRVPHYRPKFLEQLIASREVFEYWAHAAAYLPMEDFRFCLPRMRALASGARHWYARDQKLMHEVLARVRELGPLQAGDFEAHRGSGGGGMWEWGPVKQAIEQLFMEGQLLVTRRDNFAKVFDLAERVLPPGLDTRAPDQREHAQHLIDAALRANGLVRPPEVSYQRRGMGNAVREAMAERVAGGDLIELTVGRDKERWYAAPDFERLLQARQSQALRLLSPFDSLVIQRSRVQKLFGFDYQIECYLPAAQRRYGYFSLPVLWRGRLVARLDAKADRAGGCLQLRRLTLEPGRHSYTALAAALVKELQRFAAFNECAQINAGELISDDRAFCVALADALG